MSEVIDFPRVVFGAIVLGAATVDAGLRWRSS
jgi:hypothetical protein